MTAKIQDLKVVVLAGGQGSRFWPVSRQKKPKQFLAVNNGAESLIQSTVRRVTQLCGAQNIIIMTNHQHEGLVRQHVPGCSVVCEPLAKNTAASIGLAALHVLKACGEGVMVVLPADHVVTNETELLSVLSEAIAAARAHDMLVTIGIQPAFAHTGYGYLKRGKALSGRVYGLKRFYEKPSLERAQMYVQSGEYYWNSGMFVWKARVVMEAIAELMPDLHQGLMEIAPVLGTSDEARVVSKVFSALDPISIDFGVLEHTPNTLLVAAPDFGWNDVGSWDAWAELLAPDQNGNAVRGEAILIDSANCVVSAEKRLIALVGAADLVVIDSGDALLVCPREKAQDVKKIVDELKRRGRDELI